MWSVFLGLASYYPVMSERLSALISSAYHWQLLHDGAWISINMDMTMDHFNINMRYCCSHSRLILYFSFIYIPKRRFLYRNEPRITRLNLEVWLILRTFNRSGILWMKEICLTSIWMSGFDICAFFTAIGVNVWPIKVFVNSSNADVQYFEYGNNLQRLDTFMYTCLLWFWYQEGEGPFACSYI